MKKKFRIIAAVLTLAALLTLSAGSVFACSDTKDLADYFGKSLSNTITAFPEATSRNGRCFTTVIEFGGTTKDNYREATIVCNGAEEVYNIQIHGNNAQYKIHGVYCGMNLCDAVDLLFRNGYSLDATVYQKDGSLIDTYKNKKRNIVLTVTTNSSCKVTDVVMLKDF